MEKKRNRETLCTLLQQNPASFKGVRSTCEAMITNIKMNREWHYTSCNQCTKKVTDHNGAFGCEDHGQQEQPTYRYNFKAIVTDGTTDAQFTFFTPAGDKVTGHPCSELAHKYKEADPRQIPIEILNTKGQKHIFQIRFSSSTRKGSGDFAVDDILDKPDKPSISQSISSGGKKVPGTPLHDVLDTMTKTSVTATAVDKNETSNSVLDKPDKPSISQSTSSGGKKVPGTPPHDVLDTMAATSITATTVDKNETSDSLPVHEKQTTTKRALLPQGSSVAKKKKED